MKRILVVLFLSIGCLTPALRADSPFSANNTTDTSDSRLLGTFPLKPEENPFSVVEPWPPDNIPVGSLRLDSELRFEEVIHRLQPPWTLQNQYCGNNCAVDFVASQNNTTGHAPWTSGFGDEFTLAGQSRPTEHTFADLTLAYQTNYDNQYWLPVTDDHRISNEGNNDLRVMSAQAGYADDNFGLRAFTGVGHDGWEYRGDLFGLYPAQWDVQKYRDLSSDGRPVPRGEELMLNGGDLGKLTLEGGGEQVWGTGPSLYALYENKLGGVGIHYIAKYESIFWGNPGEHVQAHSVTASMGTFPGGTLDLGVLFQPFRLGWTYTHVDEVPAGQGIEGSNYQAVQRQTILQDAFGGEALYTQKLPVLIDDLMLRLQYLGRVAGNKKEFHVEASRKVSPDYTAVAQFTYQAPLEDPVPFVYEGTPGNQGAALLTPRDMEDPFWVNWNNREAEIYAFTLTYNPDPRIPFYRGASNSPTMSDLSPDISTPFAWSARYQAANYPTTMDHGYYIDACGNYIWEPAASPGVAATSRPVSEVQSIARFQVNPEFAFAVEAQGGESLATSSLPYNDTTDTLKPITDYVSGQIRFFYKKKYTTWFRYSRDLWGPYSDFDPGSNVDFQDYQREEGIVAQKLFEAGGEANLGNGFVLGIRYISVRENDNIYDAPDIASFDEYRMSLSYRFGMLAKFSNPPSQPIRPVRVEISRPDVFLHAEDPVLDASATKARVPLHLKIATKTGVSHWKFQVVNSAGQVVGTTTGVEDPPEPILWDAVDSTGKPLPAGIYQITAEGWDIDENRGVTAKPETVELKYPVPAAPKLVPVPVPVPVPVVSPAYTIQQTDLGLKVTFKSSVLFDINKSVLKPRAKDAIDQVLKLIKGYPQNNLLVEGHTDNTGSKALNDRLSQARAEAVADYLVSKGVDPARIEVHGWGYSRPVAANTSVEGRALNRRVEITILKAKQ